MNYWIAVVDDEPLSLTNAKEILNEDGMKVSCLRSGGDLMKFVEKNTPDLILLDILMPEMDGFETYHALRKYEADHSRSQIPVIFLTGDNNADVERRGLKAGASDFIRKPFNRDVLIGRIVNTIENSKKIESLTEEATTDKLTGFLNKAGGEKKISELCRKMRGVLTVFDLDNFKLINDLYGHDMGDKVLMAFSDVMRRNVRSTDTLSRIGGDEFMGFFLEAPVNEFIAALTKRINDQLIDECIRLMGDDFNVPIGISVGAACTPEDGNDFHELFRYADECMYRIKHNGKHGFAIYDPDDETTDKVEDAELEIGRISRIFGERNEGDGAMELGADPFTPVYRYMMRCVRDREISVTKVLVIMNADEVGCDIAAAAEELSAILGKSLRISDVFTQLQTGHFFILLSETTETRIEEVINDIMDKWTVKEASEKISLRFMHETVSGNRK